MPIREILRKLFHRSPPANPLKGALAALMKQPGEARLVSLLRSYARADLFFLVSEMNWTPKHGEKGVIGPGQEVKISMVHLDEFGPAIPMFTETVMRPDETWAKLDVKEALAMILKYPDKVPLAIHLEGDTWCVVSHKVAKRVLVRLS